jgi:dihydroflavonol-4-reductase
MRALVTGANGHLGYNLVATLLRAGHSVRASVRQLADPGRTEPLKALGAVELVEADIRSADAVRAVMDGIDVLFHAAAVFTYVGREQEVLDASIVGVDNALRAAAQAGVGKVVLTSSIVTLPMTLPGAPPADETQWASDLRAPYVRAKTEAERSAWRLAGELRLRLVTILPGVIIGPGFRRTTPSLDMIDVMARGGMRMGVPPISYPLVDVRDVAAAHLLAAERDCDGRFFVANEPIPTLRQVLETLHRIDPRIALPLMAMPAALMRFAPILDRLNHRLLGTPRTITPELAATLSGRVWNASSARARSVLGWRESVGMEESLRDTLEALRACAAAVSGRQALHD